MKPTLDGGSIWIDLRRIQEGTHSLVLEGREQVLRMDGESGRTLRGFVLEGAISFDGTDYRVRGSLSGTLESACDRCLEPFARPVLADVEVLAIPHDSVVDPERLDEDGAVVLASDRRLDVSDAMRKAVILEVPIKNVCREDCAGLCPECGANWNERRCYCTPVGGDPRWEALRRLSLSPDRREEV